VASKLKFLDPGQQWQRDRGEQVPSGNPVVNPDSGDIETSPERSGLRWSARLKFYGSRDPAKLTKA
jgi:hypothetical protein